MMAPEMTARELFRAEDLPVQQNRVYPTAAAARQCPRGDVVLIQDPSSGVIRNAAFDPARMVYDEHYQNEQACSAIFRDHLDRVANLIEGHSRGGTLVEIGCGKGWFLELMRSRGNRISGVDPAYEGNAPHIVKAPFTEDLGIHADMVVLRHVLEHVPAPLAFLRDIARANGGQGLIYIEVPCMDWILRRRAWFDIFYEHVNYFRPSDWTRWFARIAEAGHLFGDQYQYVIADLASLRPSAEPAAAVAFPADFKASLERGVAVRATAKGKRAVIWGAASKGVIYAIHLQRRGVDVDFAIDINPAKQGKYLPVSGLCVHSAEEADTILSPGDIVFVMNSNYLEEIRAATRNRFHYIAVDA